MASATSATRAIEETVAAALGQQHREEPVRPRTGGPAGNAMLTAWLGLLLLVLFLVESATLISMSQLIAVHIFVGAFLVPIVLLKTATTGWRMVRYYLKHEDYVQGGPPPLLLRVLGPLVVAGALAVVGTGLALIALGRSAHNEIVTMVGFRIDAITLHQAAFVLWVSTTGLHLLARFVPALQLSAPRAGTADGSATPGLTRRIMLIALGLATATVTGVLVLHAAHGWHHH
jgi:hypothetical protein